MISTILAGIFLILMGLCHFGSLIKFIPYTITTGFTSGIAVTIVIGQLKDFFGVTYPAGMETIETMQKLKAFAAGFGGSAKLGDIHILGDGYKAFCLAGKVEIMLLAGPGLQIDFLITHVQFSLIKTL